MGDVESKDVKGPRSKPLVEADADTPKNEHGEPIRNPEGTHSGGRPATGAVEPAPAEETPSPGQPTTE